MPEGLQSPGPGWRYLRYSDGEGAWISPNVKDEQWAQIKAQGEAERDAKYMAQAKAENRPINTQGKVYSATVARPAGPYGQLMAWIDHNLGGNALNANPTAQAVSNATREGLGSGARIATGAMEAFPAVRAVDLPLTALNVAKHVAANRFPALNDVPDAQTILGLTRRFLGTPELDPNASATQRVLENAASIPLGPGGKDELLRQFGLNTMRAGVSQVGGTAGEYFGGEPGQFAGSFLSPEMAKNTATQAVAPFFRGKNTTPVSEAADRQGIQPSLGSVSNPMGRLFEKAVIATPVLGGPARTAQERFKDAIRQRQLEIGSDVFGGPLPGGVSDEDIGKSLIAAARQGSANISQRASEEQKQLASDVGPNAPVDARGVYRGSSGYAAARLQMDPSNYPAYAARLDNLRQAAIEAQHPFFQQFWGQLNAGEVPYQRFQELRSNLGADIPNVASMSEGQQKLLYNAMTEAMREAAFQRGGQDLADKFDAANENYKRLIGSGGQREQLEAIGGRPQSGGWGQFAGPNGQTEPATGVDFTGGKGEGDAATWFKGRLRSPSDLAPFADPNIVPNDFWRRIVGQWLATRGQTSEGTFRPDLMAKELGGEDTKTNQGVGSDVQTQLFTGPNGGMTTDIQDVNDIATLGRNTVVPVERAGLTNTAASIYALKRLADFTMHSLGTVGGLGTMALAGRGLSDPEFVNAVRGQGTPLVNSLYAGLPAATQNILQFQNNPRPIYDPNDPLKGYITAEPPQ